MKLIQILLKQNSLVQLKKKTISRIKKDILIYVFLE